MLNALVVPGLPVARAAGRGLSSVSTLPQRSNLRSSLMEFACLSPIWAFECLTPYIQIVDYSL